MFHYTILFYKNENLQSRFIQSLQDLPRKKLKSDQAVHFIPELSFARVGVIAEID